MKTVILCGGKGTRYNNSKPKALAMIGDKPVIHHLMEIFSLQGYDDFVIALGWKQKEIIEYFEDTYEYKLKNYKINFVDTGEETNIAQRIKLIEKDIPEVGKVNNIDNTNNMEKNFFCVYCDGLANINLNKLYMRHITNKNIATITIVRPYHQFGIIRIDSDKILSFEEKPKMKEYINSGFFIFSKNIFKYIKDNDKSDIDIFKRLIEKNKLGYYRHNEFWETINSPKDEIRLNEIYNSCIENKKELEWYNIK